MISWAYFKENIGVFDIHAPTLRKIKRKWKKFSFEKKFISNLDVGIGDTERWVGC